MKFIDEMYRGRQMFSVRLDDELYQIIRNRAQQVLEILSSDSSWVSNYFKPEFEAILYSIFFGMSIGTWNKTPGMRALGLTPKIMDSSESLLSSDIDSNQFLYHAFSKIKKKFILYMVIYWIYLRLRHVSISEGWRSFHDDTAKKKLWKILQVAEFAFKISTISNTFVFLMSGSYPSLLHRLMGFKMIALESSYDNATYPLAVYRSRLLAWQVIGSFLAAMTIVKNWGEVEYIIGLISEGVVTTGRYIQYPISLTSKYIRALFKFLYVKVIGKVNQLRGLESASSSSSSSANSLEEIEDTNIVTEDFVINVYHGIKSSSLSFTTAVANTEVPTELRKLRHDLCNVPTKCCRCDLSPSEIPHYLPTCGHIYCYLCLPKLSKKLPRDVITTSTTNQRRYHCVYCRVISSGCHPITYSL